jgi:hypothetical protein
MLEYLLNGRTRALSDVTDRRVGPSVAVTTLKPVLWITSYTVVEGRYWSAAGKSFGEILTISPSGSDDVLVTMSAEETSPSKIRLQRRLLFAPIPRICLEGEIVIRGLRSL